MCSPMRHHYGGFFAVFLLNTNPRQRHNLLYLCLRFILEVTPGFEPGMRVLQTLALPLGYVTMIFYSIYEMPEKVQQNLKVAGKLNAHTRVWAFSFGAGNEARTRYLHLGKVALYQMSYARKWCLRSESNQ